MALLKRTQTRKFSALSGHKRAFCRWMVLKFQLGPVSIKKYARMTLINKENVFKKSNLKTGHSRNDQFEREKVNGRLSDVTAFLIFSNKDGMKHVGIFLSSLAKFLQAWTCAGSEERKNCVVEIMQWLF